MNSAISILEKLQTSKTDTHLPSLVKAFEKLSKSEQLSVESQFAQLLESEEINDAVRAWIPNFLGLIGTSTAEQILIEQLSNERIYNVRRWICHALIQHFVDDKRIQVVVDQLGRENTKASRLHIIRALLEANTPVIIDELIKLINDEDNYVRPLIAQRLGELQAKKAVTLLIERFAIEPLLEVNQAILKALVAIGDITALPAILSIAKNEVQSAQLRVTAIEAIGEFGDDNDEVIQILIRASCASDRLISLTSTNTLLQLVSQAEATHYLVKFGLQQDTLESLSRVADALRIVGGTDAIIYLQNIRGEPEESRAQSLLEQIGGQQAVNILINRRLDTLRLANSRVEKFDDQALIIFNKTIGEARRGFTISLLMSGTIFLIGVILLVVSIYLLLQPNSTLVQQWFGIGGSLGGLVSILAMFYKGPLERIEKSVANLVQTEIAFLGYIRQVTQISAMFEREYLDNDNFNLDQLKKILEYTEHSIKEAMPLINKYTAIPSDKSYETNKESTK